MPDSDFSNARRAFFRRAAHKTGEAIVRQADAHAAGRAAHWIRPPWALDELEFLLACTRCGACVEACPHGVIFALPARLGAQVAGTPALDLLHHGCHLCEDWPCAESCEPAALARPVSEGAAPPPRLPRLARAAIDTTACLAWQGPECGACAASCPVEGALCWDGEKPRIDMDRCCGCGLCREACIVDPRAVRVGSLYRREAAAGERE